MQQTATEDLVDKELQQQEQKDLAFPNGSKYTLVTTEDQLNEMVDQLSHSRIFAWDTETNGTFDRFKVEMVGASFACGDKAWYVPINHFEGDQLLMSTFIDAVKPLIEDPDIEMVYHNAKFDEMVISRYGVKPAGFCHDTFVMAWLLNEERGTRGLKQLNLKYNGVQMQTYEDIIESAPRKRGEKVDYNFAKVPIADAISYAASDAYYTLKLFYTLKQKLKQHSLWESYYNVEAPINRVTKNMEARGVLIDKEALDYADKRLPEIFQEVEAKIYEKAGEVFNIGSPHQLGPILFEKLGIGTNVKKTKSGLYTTDKKALERYASSHEIIKDILRRKKIKKTHSTFIVSTRDNLAEDGKLHAVFKATGTVTGRFSGSNPNLQQIETKEVEEIKIRDLFIPTPGYQFIVSDYSQVELRVMAHFSKDESMIEQFLSGADFHQQTADKMAKLMGKEVERYKAKPLNFGIGYGRTEYSVAEVLGISVPEGAEFIEAWFDAFPAVRAHKEYVISKAREEGFVRTITGRYRLIPNIRSSNGFLRARAERQAYNTKIQGSAADIIKLAMIALEPELAKWDAHMVMQVHDELVIEVPEDNAEQVLPIVKRIMEHPLNGKNPLRLPLTAEPKIVNKWGDAKD